MTHFMQYLFRNFLPAGNCYFEFYIEDAGIRIERRRGQPLETGGFARILAALPPPTALQIRMQFVFGIGIRLPETGGEMGAGLPEACRKEKGRLSLPEKVRTNTDT